MVVQEIAKARKQQKEEDAAVAKLFRNTLPAGASSLPEPADTASNQDAATENTTTSSFGVFGLIAWFFSVFQKLLSSVGIRVSGSGNQQQASA